MPLALPSLGNAVAAARQTLLRFPLVIVAGALAATSAILSVEDLGPDALHGRLVAAASLGIPLLTALALGAERHSRRRLAQIVHGAVGVALLVAVWAAWPHWSEPVRVARYAQLFGGFALLVVVVPFAFADRPRAFWQYNRVLLERALLSAAFTFTLFLGLALALAAADKLFGVDVPPTAYMRVWVVIAFVFNTWFFLGGVPADPAALEVRGDYPAVLRVFAQYALVPLVSAYLVILTLYLAKVVITWQWPSGWIGNLVSGVAAAGILAILLVQPLVDDPEQRWVGTFARQFWLALLPSIVMLWLAIWQRVQQYGITERRYALIVLSVWLAGLAVYYGVTRARGIRIIPASLCLVALLTFAGPWGAYRVSERSQVGRLRATLERAGMFASGTVRPAPRELSGEDQAEVSGTVRYLVETHGTAAIAPWFADTAARRVVLAAGARGSRGDVPEGRWNTVERETATIIARLGVPYVPRGGKAKAATFAYAAPQVMALPLRGYDYLITLQDRAPQPSDSGYVAFWTAQPLAVRVTHRGDTLLVVPLDSLLARLRAEDAKRGPLATTPAVQGPGGFRASRPTPITRPELFVVDGESRGARARVYVRSVSGRGPARTSRVETLAGRVLLALRK